jgi:pimeloyl-ACP methyl ester carboxylesterase
MDKFHKGQLDRQLTSGRKQGMQTIKTNAGTISVIVQGTGSPVVLLHGIQGTARTWDTVGPMLSNEYSVIAPNLRGRSASITPEDAAAYRLSTFADDLRAVLAWIGQPTVLTAWSMGVSVTLEMIRVHGNCNLRGLVLASGSPCVGDEAHWFHGATAAEVAEEARERGKRLSLVEAAAPHAVAASWQHVKQADFRVLLADIKLPTLVIHGADDDQCPIAHGRMLAQQIPGARLDEWSETGHNPMAKDAWRFASAVRDFIITL